MKKFFLGGLVSLTILMVILPSVVMAEEIKESPFSTIRRIPETAKNFIEQRFKNGTKSDEVKKTTLQQAKNVALRNSVNVRFEVLTRALGRTEGLVEKVQVRLDTATSEGKDITKATVALEEANGNLISARSTLALIESEKEIAVNKDDYVKIHAQFQQVQKSLNLVRQSLVKTIIMAKDLNPEKKTKEVKTMKIENRGVNIQKIEKESTTSAIKPQ